MSRHAAPVSKQEHALASHLPAALLVIVLTTVLAIGTATGDLGLALCLAVVQLVIIGSWAVAVVPPGIVGVLLFGGASAAASDALLTIRQHDGVAPLSGLLGLLFIGLAIHQLCRGVARVRLMESLSSAVLQCLCIIAISSYLALVHISRGDRLVLACVISSGAALLVGYAVDVILPAPRFHEGIPRGLIAVGASTGIAAIAGWIALSGMAGVGHGGGALLGAAVGLSTALLAVSAAYISENLPRPTHKFSVLGISCLTVIMPLSLSAPVAYLFGLAITS